VNFYSFPTPDNRVLVCYHKNILSPKETQTGNVRRVRSWSSKGILGMILFEIA
jgi:hypothetical protein